jgi:N12 class adenine-specific DNA methylase/GGDEF domain-containing protein
MAVSHAPIPANAPPVGEISADNPTLWQKTKRAVGNTIGTLPPFQALEGAQKSFSNASQYVREQGQNMNPDEMEHPDIARAYKYAVAPAGAAAGNFLAGMADPKMAAMVAAFGGIPTTGYGALVHTAIGAYFTGKMGIEGVKSAYQTYKASQKGNVPEAVEQGMNTVFSLGMAAEGVRGMKVGVADLPEAKGVGVQSPRGTVRGAVVQTPEGTTVSGKLGPLEGSKTFKGKSAPPPAEIEAPTIQGEEPAPKQIPAQSQATTIDGKPVAVKWDDDASTDETARPAVQASSDPTEIRQSAQEQKPVLAKEAAQVVSNVPGGDVEGVRVKDAESQANKAERGKAPETNIDNLGARVSGETPQDVAQIRQNVEQTLPVVGHDKITSNGLDADQYAVTTGKPGDANQVSELQVTTKAQAETMKETDPLYDQQKKALAAGDQAKADEIGKQITAIHQQAQPTNTGAPSSSSTGQPPIAPQTGGASREENIATGTPQPSLQTGNVQAAVPKESESRNEIAQVAGGDRSAAAAVEAAPPAGVPQSVEKQAGSASTPESAWPPSYRAGGERRSGSSPVQQDLRKGERRGNEVFEKMVSQMTPEERAHVLLTDDKTGIGNERAFNEAQSKSPSPFVAMSDVDGLGAINDRFGHDAGDAILRAKAEALQASGVEAYHLHGDEFGHRGNDEKELRGKLEAARNDLQNREFRVIDIRSGEEFTVTGSDFSYGIGNDKPAADRALYQHKDERLRRGERSGEKGKLGGRYQVARTDGERPSESGTPSKKDGGNEGGGSAPPVATPPSTPPKTPPAGGEVVSGNTPLAKGDTATLDGKTVQVEFPGAPAVNGGKAAPARVILPGGKKLLVDPAKLTKASVTHVDTEPIGKPIPERVAQIKEQLAKGVDVRIFTARVANDPQGEARAEIEQWSEKQFGRKLPITNAKDDNLAFLLDDKANIAPNANEPFQIPPIPKGKWLGVDLDRTLAVEKPQKSEPAGAVAQSAKSDAEPRYKFGNTQAVIPEGSDAAKALESARARISDGDLEGDGKDVGGNHVTVRYGIQGENTESIQKFLSQQSPFEASLGKTESFAPSEHSDGAAPIIAPIEAPELHRIERELDKHGDFKERSFPEYKPHATVAYVKPDRAARYTGMTVTEGKQFTVDSIAITDRNGNETPVKLEGKATPAVPKTWKDVARRADKPAAEEPKGTWKKAAIVPTRAGVQAHPIADKSASEAKPTGLRVQGYNAHASSWEPMKYMVKDAQGNTLKDEFATREEAQKWADSHPTLDNGNTIKAENGNERSENQPARTSGDAENLSGVSKPARNGGDAPAPVPAEGKPENEVAGNLPSNAGRADAASLERDERRPEGGSKPERSAGNGDAAHSGEGREGRSAGREGTAGVDSRERVSEPSQGRDGADGRLVKSPTPEPPEKAQKTTAELRNQHNFRISDEYASRIGSGGEITKIKGNLDALELLKKIQTEGRELATPEEQETLAKYVDFGGLVGMLENPYSKEYKAHYERFESILTPEERQEINETLPNTHYTSLQMVDFMWKAMQRLGFKGGRITEPGMGIGNFYGRIPEKIAKQSQLYGVERNPLTGAMAKLLYPDAKIMVKPYQQVMVPDNSMDVFIGNVPFQDFAVTDDSAYAKLKLNLHNYFIVKSLDKLKPGGIAALITSRYTMDNSKGLGYRAREEMAKRADLIAAIRLPDKAFKGNAGTEVVADLLIFQKRAAADVPETMPDWTTLAPITAPGQKPVMKSYNGHEYIENESKTKPKDFNISKYFVDHPDHVLGAHSQAGTMYGPGQYTVKAPDDFTAALNGALELLPKNIFGKVKGPDIEATPETLQPGEIDFAPDDVKPGAFFKDAKGNIKIKEAGVGKDLPLELKTPDKMAHISSAIDLRDQLNRTIQVELSSSDDAPMLEEQKRLNDLYDTYRKKYGSTNAPALHKVFGDDPEYPKLRALEDVDPESKTATKSDIFRKRVLAPYEPLRDLPDDPKSAMLKVIAERGGLDTKLMGELLKKDEQEVIGSLEEKGLIYQDPKSGHYQTADEYLSGNVREKLRQAEQAVDTDPKYKANVEALQKAQPKPLTIHDIQPNLGATWIPNSIYKGFISHLAGARNLNGLEISRNTDGRWLVQLKGASFDLDNKWAGGGIPGHKLVQSAMNQQQPTVWINYDDGTRELDQPATTAAREKLAAIKEEFRTVLRRAPQKTIDQLEQIYNDTFNSHKVREFSGEHLDFPGMSEEWKGLIRGYQKASVWRGVQEGRAGLFHAPGLGKTLTMAAMGMEAKRLKLSRKNMYAVPNHMIPQWRQDFKRFYPNANVLAVSDEDFTPQNRNKLMSRIATGDWDAIIVPHSQFDLLPMSAEWEKKSIDARLDDYRRVLEELDDDDKRTKKQIEKAIDKLESKLHDLNNKKKDNTITFDQMGVDMLFVDEAHLYKSMAVPTKMGNVGGLSNSASQRAFALEMKANYLRDTHNGRGLVLGTGTPITNTIGELYVMTKYLAPEMLEQAGIRNFDDWAANFATTRTEYEYAVDGVTFKPKTTLSEFVNVPELSTMFQRFAEYLSKDAAKQLSNLKEPEVARHDHMVKITPTQEPLLQMIADRGENLTKNPPKTREERQADNWLKLSSDARKVSLDPRLYNPRLPDDAGSKANQAVAAIKKVLDETKKEKGTVAVFSDFFQHKDGSGKADFNLFDDMRKKLVKAGIPKDQIALIHDAGDNKDKKEAMFAKVRSGKIRVIFGSTDKMGIGTNIQDRLKAELHLDQPWRPDQVEQREGRIQRSGNQWEKVDIHRFIAEPETGTYKVKSVTGYKMGEDGKDHPIYTEEEKPRPRAYDLQMYQQLARKANFQEQFLSGNYTGRSMEDVGGDVKMNSQMFQLGKAMATGNPDALLKMKLENDLRTFNLLERNFQTQRSKQTRELDYAELKVPALKKEISNLEKLVDTFESHVKRDGEKVSYAITLGGKEIDSDYIDSDPDLGVLVGKPITIAGIETEISRAEDKYLDKKSGEWLMATKYTYRLNGEDWTIPTDDQGQQHLKAMLGSFMSRARHMKSNLESNRNQLTRWTEDREKLKAELKNTSPYIDKVEAMEKQIKEINQRLGMTGPADLDEGAAVGEDDEQEKRPAVAKPAKPAAKPTDGTTMNVSLFGVDLAAKAAAKVAAAAYENELKPALDKAKVGLGDALTELQHLIAPRVGVEPRALSSIMRMTGAREKHRYTLQQVLNGARTMFSKLPQAEQIRFIDHYKLGEAQATAELDEVAKFFRKTDEATYRNVIDSQIANIGGWADRAWSKLPESAKAEMVHSLEDYRGGTSRDAREKQLEAIEDLLEANGVKSTRMMRTGLADVADSILSYKENHYRVLWKKIPGAEDGAERSTPRPGAKRPLQGSRGFLRQSTLDTMSEGLEAGGEPYSFNPVEMFERAQDDSWRYITAQRMWKDAETLNGRIFVPRGERAPDGYEKIEDKIGNVRFPAASGEGSIEAGNWYLREDWARLMNNYLGHDAIRESAVGRGIMDVKNRLTAWRLAMSPFHALTESGLSMASQFGHGLATGWNLGVRHGDLKMVGQGALEALKTPLAPFTDSRRGGNVIRYLTNKEEFLKSTRGKDFLKNNRDADRMITDLFSSGAKLGMHEDEQIKGLEGMRQAAANDKYIEALLKAMAGTNGLIQKPLFNYYIPRIKAGMFMRDYARELADHQADIDAGTTSRAEIGRKVWDAIEDTAGQMNWDARFWNRTFKSSIQLAFRAFTWRAGNARLVYKAGTGQANEMIESLKAMHDHFTDGEKADPSSTAVPRIDPNLARIIGLLVTYGVVNALIQKSTTGENPKDYKDLLAARIGGKDSYGHPLRITAPAILLSDWMSLQSHGLKGYISSGLSDLVGGMDDVLANKDFRNVMIHDPDDPMWKQRWDDTKHIAGAPISIGNMRKLHDEGASKAKAASMLLGLKPAPQTFDMTAAERMAQEINRTKIPERTPSEADEHDAKRQAIAPVREALRNGNRSALYQAVAEGKITRKQAMSLLTESRRPPLVNAIEGFTLEQAQKVYNVATPEEKKLLDPIMRVKYGREMKNSPAQGREKLKAAYAALKGGS